MTVCFYCHPKGEDVVWQGRQCRVILADEPGFTGWCRVVLQAHIRELSDLDDATRDDIVRVVSIVERTLIADLKPVKMNIAALGTGSPHLHFHVIPRFTDDATFPEPVWLARRHRNVGARQGGLADRLRVALSVSLG
jgi:diadenosine tetraphosphate (Ap4A) HIT family hydrolase